MRDFFALFALAGWIAFWSSPHCLALLSYLMGAL